MSKELTNKELAAKLKDLNYCNVVNNDKHKELERWKSVQLAAERLAAMPDVVEQEPKEIDIQVQRKEFERLVDEYGGYSAITGDATECFSWFLSGVDFGLESCFYQPQQPAPDKEAVAVINGLLDYAWSHTCTHEDTYRGGVLWEICNWCGAKWADDKGGKPEFETPEAIRNAEAHLAKVREGIQIKTEPNKETIKRYCIAFMKDVFVRKMYDGTDEEMFDQFWQQQSAEGGE